MKEAWSKSRHRSRRGPARTRHQPPDAADDRARRPPSSVRGSAPAASLCSASPGRGPSLWTQPNQSGAQPVGGLHLQFGKDASTEVVVSWHTTDPVHNPRVMIGHPDRPASAAPCKPRPAPTVTRSRTPRSASTTRGSTTWPPTPTTSTPRFTTAPTPSGDRADRSVRAETVALHQFRRPGHPDAGPIQEPHLPQRQPGLPGGRRHHHRDRTYRLRCSTSSTATCATRTSPTTASAPGRTGSTTTPARRATGRGCRRRATMRTN